MKLERKPEKLGAILTAHEMASARDVEVALAEQKKTGERIGEALVRKGAASPEDVYWALANQFNISFMPIDPDQVDPEIVRILPEDMERRQNMLPLLKVANDLIIVVDDPLNEGAFEDAEGITGLDVSLCLGRTSEIQDALDSVYGARVEEDRRKSSIKILAGRFSKKEISELSSDENGAALLDRILKEADAEGLESIHIDRVGAETVVRARIWGRLQPWVAVSGGLGAALATRIRVLAGISAKGADASGVLQHEVKGKQRAVNVAIIPASNGESILLRPPVEAAGVPPMAKLGFTKAQLKMARSMAQMRRGLIVATGPRGSGKTSTLYSIFKGADPKSEKLVVVAEEGGGEAGSSLCLRVENDGQARSMLEQALAADPDAVLLQPIPGPETLEKAVNEALSGVKVGAQLAFPDAASALAYIVRSVDAQTAASALTGVIAQRIARILCDKCKKAEKPPPSLKIKDAKPFKAVGCPSCGGFGYKGRAAIYEIVLPDADMRALLGERPDGATLRKALTDMGMETLRDRALDLYANGVASREDIAEFL